MVQFQLARPVHAEKYHASKLQLVKKIEIFLTHFHLNAVFDDGPV